MPTGSDVFASQTYQTRANSMFKAKGAHAQGKPVVAMMLEPMPSNWMSVELKGIVGSLPGGWASVCGSKWLPAVQVLFHHHVHRINTGC